MEKSHADFQVRDEGTIVLVWMISDAAVSWAKEHLPVDAIRWSGAYVVEHRYADDILDGLAADGLVGRAASIPPMPAA